MCGGCGAGPHKIDWFSAGVPQTPGARLQSMIRLAAAANVLFETEGLRSRAAQGGQCMSVSTTTGRSVVASDPMAVRAAAEQLTGHVLDPLAVLHPKDSGGTND